jgi:membrane protein
VPVPDAARDPARDDTNRTGPSARLLATGRAWLGRVLALPPVAAAVRVIARYSAADGGLLAGGLAYAALFAIVPSILLAAGVVGMFVGDPARRTDAISFVAAVLPPLHDLVQAILEDAGRDAGALGVLGAVTLVWAASRFVVTFADTVARVMGHRSRRGALAQNLAAVGVVLLMPLVLIAGVTLAGLTSFLGLAQQQGLVGVIGSAAGFALGFMPAVATVLVVGLVYRIVPTPPAPWRALGVPAIVVGLALTILLQAFVFIAPRLIGSAALLGTIATVFAVLAWLSLSFQAILLGAAWVGEREASAASLEGGAGSPEA